MILLLFFPNVYFLHKLSLSLSSLDQENERLKELTRRGESPEKGINKLRKYFPIFFYLAKYLILCKEQKRFHLIMDIEIEDYSELNWNASNLIP